MPSLSIHFENSRRILSQHPARWVVSGAAGFIGSHLVEELLRLDQRVVGIDDFSTGFEHNLQDVRQQVGDDAWSRFRFIEGDVRSKVACDSACEGAQYVLHQAALGSVPRSLADPATSTDVNVNGLVQMLDAAHRASVRRVIFASSSSVYGDDVQLPKKEECTGAPLSPYAATKVANELFAAVFARSYELEVVGLRYFNVFGPRQDPKGAYAAVIPRWIASIAEGNPGEIFGDGKTSRDFSFIANIVQGNILAALGKNVPDHDVFNIAAGGRTTLTQLYEMIRTGAREISGDSLPSSADRDPLYRGFRSGDIAHSHADVSKARRVLGYKPTHDVDEGLRSTIAWYFQRDQGNLPPRARSTMVAAGEDHTRNP